MWADNKQRARIKPNIVIGGERGFEKLTRNKRGKPTVEYSLQIINSVADM